MSGIIHEFESFGYNKEEKNPVLIKGVIYEKSTINL